MTARICKACESAPVVRDSNVCRKCKTRLDAEKRRRERRLPTIEDIKHSTSVSNAMKGLLDTLEEQDKTPLPLIQWIRTVLQESRRLGYDDSQTIRCIKVYAREGNWHPSQVYCTLTYLGVPANIARLARWAD